MTVERINEHPVLKGLEGQWEKVVLLIMNEVGVKEFRITREVIERLERKYRGDVPTLVCEGLGPTGEEVVSLRMVSGQEARRMAERGKA